MGRALRRAKSTTQWSDTIYELTGKWNKPMNDESTSLLARVQNIFCCFPHEKYEEGFLVSWIINLIFGTNTNFENVDQQIKNNCQTVQVVHSYENCT